MPTPTLRVRHVVLWLLALIGLGVAPPAQAQGDDSGVTGAVVGEVEFSADLVGIGNTARAGGWIGIRVRYRDNGDATRELALQVELRDADGDRPVYQRVAASNQGRLQQIWLYVYLPYRFDPSRGLRLTAREVVGESGAAPSGDGAPGASAPSGPRARVGRLLAEATAMPGQMLADYEGMLGVVGDSTHGLSLYASSLAGMNFSPLAHERTEIVSRLEPMDLPDRWMGLSTLETLAWANADPSDLGPERSRAVREWIERGGHLVIVLSVENVGPWTTSANNLLRDLFPAVEVVTREGVDLEAYRPLLTRDPDLALPSSAMVHTFEPLASASPDEAVRVLTGPEGECLVARRLVGHGMVTVVGMGVGNRVLSNIGLPAADVFWNRVLGRRGQYEPLTRLNDINTSAGVNLTNREEPVTLDRAIDGELNLEGQSLAGVVLAFAVFGLYWLVAGPGGFAVLKKTGRDRHAWVGFVAAAMVFTAIAWGGATIIKPKNVEVRHVTVLDHVYGQDVDRARTWMSVLVPSYLGATVSVENESESAGVPRFYQAIAPWEDRPDATLGGGGGSFPDARAYEVESRAPDHLDVPTRATVKQFMVDWAGSPRLAWPVPAGASGEAMEGVSIDPVTRRPVGVLTHNLPGALTEVKVILVRGQQGLRVFGRGRWTRLDGRATQLSALDQYFVDASAVDLLSDWAPGTPLDLSAAFDQPGQDTSLVGWLRRASGAGRQSLMERLMFASVFQQMEPPDLGPASTSARLERTSTHGLDLSRWMSQPCLIVMGVMEDSGRGTVPVPVSVRIAGDDRTLHSKGQTLVRWVFPLGERATEWPTAEDIQRGRELDRLGQPRESGGGSDEGDGGEPGR